MQIILMEKVAHLGNLGDLVKVRDGYARNFLIPTGRAKRATPAALQEFETKRAELENAAAAKLAAAQEQAAQMADVVVRIARKAGVDGRLFGSVSNFDIADGLRGLGFEIEKSAVRMPKGPLKNVGENRIEVALHGDVLATITVAVVAEQPKL
ncbi:MAG TPA: 50S ribosomal protein L9 [Accumulibacter sp.]|uniref:50S ribosomal protein L9 n=1 Tax=Accumulibacter sp. TaxID=2053492 RepID=UPI002616EBD1|nr:50S ribosomal protein L9 [Accumulibacter sp.]MDS4053539.1 50S ribosomal protein L9 [Accumulibacter sp.]HMV05063.1 50S ribosomal protein L9 [Accumulibacter sp.]HMW65022.1 50S ribosomal protein L9 [Accumulibacter sp.]HMW80853.1 50S ribosomal protein L9 [Accumulibacter sp.]HMX68390.1 50S ribosomal protein L9 [Accumulibacter sp.]